MRGGVLAGSPGSLISIIYRDTGGSPDDGFAEGFLANSVVPEWFHVVPTRAHFPQLLVWPRPDAHLGRGSCVVPCGSYSAARSQALIWPRPALTSGMVPLWFHVVPKSVHFLSLLDALSPQIGATAALNLARTRAKKCVVRCFP